MFYQTVLAERPHFFSQLASSAIFESVAKGRLGAIVVEQSKGLVPLVRSTTIYQQAAGQFTLLHHQLVAEIRSAFPALTIPGFNNIMIEMYQPSYRNMKFHSDQAMDLADPSYIAIFSLYEQAETPPRTLQIQHKLTGQEQELMMTERSVILFSTATNRHHLHRIIAKQPGRGRWLGLTLRLAQTLIKFIDERPYFARSCLPLTLANETERAAFYQAKRLENETTDQQDLITYTISPSDLLPIRSN